MTIIKVTNRLEIYLLVEIDGHCIEVEVDLDKIVARIIDKIIEADHKTLMEMTLGQIITEVKIIEIEVEVETVTGTCTETITEMTIDDTIHLAETDVG